MHMQLNRTFVYPRQEIHRFHQRLLVAIIGIAVLMLILFVRLYLLQIKDHERYTTLSRQNQLVLIPIPPHRGLIYDRNGVLLARNAPIYSLVVIPDRVTNLKKTLTELEQLVNLTEDDLQQFAKLRAEKRRFEAIPLKLKLTEAEIAAFAVNQYRFPGVLIQDNLIREYPFSEHMTSILGYVGRINAEEERKLDSNYAATQFIGKLGIEKYFETDLHGQAGYQQVEKDASGRIVRVVNRKLPVSGKNLMLTIDMGLQMAAAKILQNQNVRGSLVALKPKTGEILVLVNNPSYDPNLFVQGIRNKTYQALRNDPDRPLYNRALRGLYPLASTIKPFLGIQGLRTHTVTPELTIFDPGYFKLPNYERPFRDYRRQGHGFISYRDAITKSSDTYFYRLAYGMGIYKMYEILTEFGFGKLTGIESDEEIAGLIPTPAWKQRVKKQRWYPGDTVVAGIGQGYMLTTPLQLAVGAATLANQGERPKPTLLLKAQLSNGEFKQNKSIIAHLIEADDSMWENTLMGMRGVVNAPGGTAYRAFLRAPYSAAGKTGTAQLFKMNAGDKQNDPKVAEYLKDHSLFIAFAPFEEPEIALAVVIENNPRTAQFIAREFLDYYFSNRSA